MKRKLRFGFLICAMLAAQLAFGSQMRVDQFTTTPAYLSGTYALAVAAGDFNSDGKLDLAVIESGSVNVLLGKGNGAFGKPVTYAAGSSPDSVAIADFNGDGFLDLAVAGGSGVSILLGKGDGTFQAAVSYPAGLTPDFIVIGDFNGDGKPDIAVSNPTPPSYRQPETITVLYGKGDGSFEPPLSISIDIYVLLPCHRRFQQRWIPGPARLGRELQQHSRNCHFAGQQVRALRSVYRYRNLRTTCSPRRPGGG